MTRNHGDLSAGVRYGDRSLFVRAVDPALTEALEEARAAYHQNECSWQKRQPTTRSIRAWRDGGWKAPSGLLSSPCPDGVPLFAPQHRWGAGPFWPQNLHGSATRVLSLAAPGINAQYCVARCNIAEGRRGPSCNT